MSEFKFITPRILHVDMATSYDVGSMFIRMQEFYECPNEEFRRKYFTLDQYMDWYAATNGTFSYFDDWAGFNIPGNVLLEFWKLFSDVECTLRNKEQRLFWHLREFIESGDSDFYVIGTSEYDDNTLTHELRHAHYHLSPEYRRECDAIYSQMPESVIQRVHFELKIMGYTDIVFADETQAYFGADSLTELCRRFGLTEAEAAPWSEKFKNVVL